MGLGECIWEQMGCGRGRMQLGPDTEMLMPEGGYRQGQEQAVLIASIVSVPTPCWVLRTQRC